MSGPLAGRTVLLTRDEGLADEVRELGAEVRTVQLLSYEAVPAETDIESFDWVVLTSHRAVRFLDAELDRAARIACVGPATADAVREKGGTVSLVPARHDAESLAGEMVAGHDLSGLRVLFPCSEEALGTIEESLSRAGSSVERLVVYRPRPAASLPPGVTDGVDVIVFLAPSAVNAFADLGGDLRAAAVLAIGPTTADAVVKRGGIPATAPTSDREGLLRALRDWEFCT